MFSWFGRTYSHIGIEKKAQFSRETAVRNIGQ